MIRARADAQAIEVKAEAEAKSILLRAEAESKRAEMLSSTPLGHLVIFRRQNSLIPFSHTLPTTQNV